MTPDEAKIEGAKARLWREDLGLSRVSLGRLVGYSDKGIAAIEAGAQKYGAPISEDSLRTYRLACAAAVMGLEFDWAEIRIPPVRSLRQRVVAAPDLPQDSHEPISGARLADVLRVPHAAVSGDA